MCWVAPEMLHVSGDGLRGTLTWCGSDGQCSLRIFSLPISLFHHVKLELKPAGFHPAFICASLWKSKQTALSGLLLEDHAGRSLCSVSLVPCSQTNYCASICIKWHLPSAAKSLWFSLESQRLEYLTSSTPHVWSVLWLTREGQSWKEVYPLHCRISLTAVKDRVLVSAALNLALCC